MKLYYYNNGVFFLYFYSRIYLKFNRFIFKFVTFLGHKSMPADQNQLLTNFFCFHHTLKLFVFVPPSFLFLGFLIPKKGYWCPFPIFAQGFSFDWRRFFLSVLFFTQLFWVTERKSQKVFALKDHKKMDIKGCGKKSYSFVSIRE